MTTKNNTDTGVKAGELRLGNWISYDGNQWKVVDVLCDCINTLGHEGLTYDQIEGVPLTKEILETMGFRYGKTGKKNDDSFTQFWDIKTPQHPNNFGSWTFTVVRWWENSKPQDFVFSHHNMRQGVKYIHQLQNIFWALTGEELIYNPQSK